MNSSSTCYEKTEKLINVWKIKLHAVKQPMGQETKRKIKKYLEIQCTKI